MKGINGALAASYVNALLTHGLTERQFKHLDTDVLAELTDATAPNKKPLSLAQTRIELAKVAQTSVNETISHNARLLCDIYQVPLNGVKVIEYLITLGASSALRNLVDELHLCELTDDIHRSLLTLFGIEEEVCFSYLRLLTNRGFIQSPSLTDTGDIALSEEQVRLLTRAKLKSIEAYLDRLLKESPSATFALKDFSHLDIETLHDYLREAIKQRVSGVNILIYGDAGTGKTELARTLAHTLSMSLYETRTTNTNNKQIEERYDEEGNSRLRLQYLSSMQGMLANHPTSMFVVDECESIFLDSDQYFAKDTLHRLMESNPVPCIWITNHVMCLESSFIRRFKIVQEVGAIEGKYIKPLAKQAFKGLRLKQPYIDNLLTTANTGQSAELVVSGIIQNTLKAASLLDAPLRYTSEMPFDVSLLNIKQGKETVKQIGAALKNHAPVRILLSGEPGTGKTAYAHYLSQLYDLELVSVRCSDILSKYIGESETNIANIFHDAQQHGNALLLDEVDSILVSRERVTEQHNIQLINELLTQIECFEQPVFVATNYATLLDKAVLRRFDFKLEALCLTHEQRITLFRRVLSLKQLTQFEQQQLSTLTQLTAGDFAIVARRMRFQPDGDFRQQALALLIEENRHKQPNHPIGFVSKPH